ncbi:hypothetical protein V5O39_09980 [Pseudomonas parakoreensis]
MEQAFQFGQLHQFIVHCLRVESQAVIDGSALIFEDIALDKLIGHADSASFDQPFAL